jgi:pimeloyl-ACP methyl ester carboxylesterase
MRLAAIATYLVLAAPPALAQTPWLRLPPTPALPTPETTATVTIAGAGAAIWCAEYGTTHKTAVVLLHGGNANSAYWGKLIPELARTYRVIVLDSRGQGRSSAGTAPIGYEQMAKDTLAVLDHFAIQRAALVGWSDGAITGLIIAWHHPERLSRLFAFAANSEVSGSHDAAPGITTFADFDARTRGEYAKLSPTPGNVDASNKSVHAMWLREPNMTAGDLASIRVPTWIVDGDHDEVIDRKNTDFMAANIPNARELILPGVSHFAFLQDPSMFNFSVLRFLTQRD